MIGTFQQCKENGIEEKLVFELEIMLIKYTDTYPLLRPKFHKPKEVCCKQKTMWML